MNKLSDKPKIINKKNIKLLLKKIIYKNVNFKKKPVSGGIPEIVTINNNIKYISIFRKPEEYSNI
jgi:hypothetical protein